MGCTVPIFLLRVWGCIVVVMAGEIEHGRRATLWQSVLAGGQRQRHGQSTNVLAIFACGFGAWELQTVTAGRVRSAIWSDLSGPISPVCPVARQ